MRRGRRGWAVRAVFMDATPALAGALAAVRRADDPAVEVNLDGDVAPAALPGLLRGVAIALDDHTAFPVEIARACPDLRHVVFLGAGARSYMDPEALAGLGIALHTIRGYGDTAVAEHTIALLWAAARGIAVMDRGVRAGGWPRLDGMQLTGRTLGLVGFGGIAREVARIAVGSGMRVVAWNRTPLAAPGVEFVELEALLGMSHAVSVHLALTEATRGFLDARRLGLLRPGAILVNTARGAVLDEGALLAGLRDGRIGHAALDVFDVEPLPLGHPLAGLDNVTLSAHSAFRTPEASENLLRAALDHCRRIVAGGIGAGARLAER